MTRGRGKVVSTLIVMIAAMIALFMVSSVGAKENPPGCKNETPGANGFKNPNCTKTGDTEGPAGDPTCSDGLDNDGDGATDQHDTGCQSPEGPPGDPSCSDGVDNDGDDKTDQQDSDCQSPEGPPGSESCSDGVDNDGDGKTDGQDSDCQAAPTEGPPGDPTCSDGLDNDGDGTTDQQDTGCQSPEGPPGDPTCSDNVDNDGDGDTDGDDSDCQGGGATNSCAHGGLLEEETVAEQVFGPGLDEVGPVSDPIHNDLEPEFPDTPLPLQTVVHEGGCAVRAGEVIVESLLP